MSKKDLMNEAKGPFKYEENGIKYASYRWKGHTLVFLEEDVEVYEWYIMNTLEEIIPLYVYQTYRTRSIYDLTDKEVKDAVLDGMCEELFLYSVRIEEHTKQWEPNKDWNYNENVGIAHFREPQELTDKKTAWQHTNRWCILQRCYNGMSPKVVCYTTATKYAEKIKTLFINEYLGKGYDLFFHFGNGEGSYMRF